MQGLTSPQSGKEGFGVGKPPCPPPPKEGVGVKKSHSHTGHHMENALPDCKRPVLGWGEIGIFRRRNPLFPDFEDFGSREPCETSQCPAAKVDSPLSHEMSPKLPLSPTREVRFSFSLFQKCLRGEGNCAATAELSRGNFSLAALRCLSRPSGDPCPKDPAVLKTLRVVNHYRDSNSLPR